MPLSIVVIGCGGISNSSHGPAYLEYAQTHPGTLLAACCDHHLERAADFRERFGFLRTYRDPLEMLERERPDAVCLNVPPKMLSELGCEVLRRGHALLSEKPPGLTVGEIDRLIVAARENGTLHQVAFNRRFMPLAAELKARLAGEPVQHLNIQMARVGRTDANFATTAVHAIDAARFFAASDFQELRFQYQEQAELGSGVANFILDGCFASGATAQLSFQPISGTNIERSAIYTRDQVFFLDANTGPDAPGRLRHFRQGQLVADLDAVQFCGRSDDYFINGFYQEDAAFFDAVQAGVQPVHSFQSCRQSVEIMACLSERRASYLQDDKHEYL